MLTYVGELDEAQKQLHNALHSEANMEHIYRQERRKAFISAEAGTVDERNAEVDATCADARRERDRATGDAKAALEAVRNKRQSLSALQSIANSVREEAAFARVGPDVEKEHPANAPTKGRW